MAEKKIELQTDPVCVKIKDYMLEKSLSSISLSTFEKWNEDNDNYDFVSSGIHSVKYNQRKNRLNLYAYRDGSSTIMGKKIMTPTATDYSDAYNEIMFAAKFENRLPAAVRRNVFVKTGTN